MTSPILPAMQHATLHLIMVARCPLSPSLYSRWQRPEMTQPSESQPRVIAIRLVLDHKWSPRSTGDLIAIKCWSRQALVVCSVFIWAHRMNELPSSKLCEKSCSLSQCDLTCEIFFTFRFSSVFTDIFPFQLRFNFCQFFRFSFSLFYF